MEKQNLKYLNWSRIRNSSGTAGSFLKAQSTDSSGKKKYYKLSAFDSVRGIIGHECINEIIADRLLNLLHIDHLHYELIYADIVVDNKNYETFLCVSEDFKTRNESKLSLDILYEKEKKPKDNPLLFCKRMGWADYIYEMLIVDYLILNRDRHGANIEVLRDSRKKTYRIAPLFDHGLSLLFSCQDKTALEAFDIMADLKCNNFIGSSSVKENLSLVPKKVFNQLPHLSRMEIKTVFDGLEEAIDKEYIDKMLDMIWKRWNYIEGLRSKR